MIPETTPDANRLDTVTYELYGDYTSEHQRAVIRRNVHLGDSMVLADGVEYVDPRDD